MTRRVKRSKVVPCELSEEAEAMLSRHTELTRIDPLFRRTKHQDEAIFNELGDAGIFRAHRRSSNAPILLSEIGVERARTIRSARLTLEPKESEQYE